jgi:YHS domain-containing protein
MNKAIKLLTVVVLITGVYILAGCGSENDDHAGHDHAVHNHAAQQAEGEAAMTGEQTLCPVMDAPINKEYFVEYKGKMVYFCCPGCEKQFLENPEKYLHKLPQFKQ